QILAQLRAIYTEVTGNKAAAEELSAQALINEVHDKGGRAQASAAQAELANERAGLVPVPADLSARSLSERMLRVLVSQGDVLGALELADEGVPLVVLGVPHLLGGRGALARRLDLGRVLLLDRALAVA